MKTESQFLSLNSRQWIKGLFLAILGAFLVGLNNSLQSGELPSTWIEFKPLLMAGLLAGITYLMTSFASNSKGEILKSEKSEPFNPTLPIVLAFILLSTFAMADTIKHDTVDLIKLGSNITTGVNGVIAVIPTPPGGISVLKAILMACGTGITTFFIGIFVKRNKNKAK